MSIVLPICLPIASSCAYGYDGAAPAPPIERVQNGEFANGDFWDTGGGWSISLGSASNSVAGISLRNTLIAATSAGQSFVVSVDALANPAGTGWGVQLRNSGTGFTQTVLLPDPFTGTKTDSGTVDGVYDQLDIVASDDAGLVVDNVSFVS